MLLRQNSLGLAPTTFLDHVLVPFGSLIEVLTNQGREFCKIFEEFCTKALIDHCTTSKNHPKIDGLTKKMVYIVKHGLRKYGLLKGNHKDWNLKLQWIAMNY